MRPLLIATVLVALPGAVFAQSTVGAVSQNPNAMPAVNGSKSPAVSSAPTTGQAPAAASQPPSATQPSSTGKHHRKSGAAKTAMSPKPE